MTFVILYTSNVSFLVKLDENLYHVIFAYVAYNLNIKTLKKKNYFPYLLHVYRYSSLSLSPPPPPPRSPKQTISFEKCYVHNIFITNLRLQVVTSYY